MSDYDYRGSNAGTRYRDREPEYVSETTYIQRGPGRPSTDLVYRGRDREDSAEEIVRDFPPTAEYRRSSQRPRDDLAPRRRSHRYDDRYDDRYDEDDDYYSDYGPSRGAAYGGRGGGGRSRRQDNYYDDAGDYYSEDTARPKPQRRKSRVEKTLEGLGLGGAVGTILDKVQGTSSKSQRASPNYDESRGGDYDKHKETQKKWQQAAKAAVLSGVVEAVRSRNEPGGWTGPKGQRIATAALGAAGIDGLLDRNPREKSKRHIIESAVGGLAANRLANGPRDRSGSRGRSRSRSRSVGGLRARSKSLMRSLSRGGRRSPSVDSRGRSLSYSRSPSPRARSKSRGRGLAELAAAGGVVAAGKALYDRVRSKSRGRARSPSVASEDSYVPEHRQRYGNDRAIDQGADARGPSDTRGDRNDADAPTGRELARRGEGGSRKRDSSSDSVDTIDLENQRKKTRDYQGDYRGGQSTYQDGNPYANLPPPPMGQTSYR